uniref:Uncharacterized protein n=1 Tax=Anguilla anguilla TaxID=7936 RepID=A0A0E9S4U3_ANGAN
MYETCCGLFKSVCWVFFKPPMYDYNTDCLTDVQIDLGFFS